MARVGGTDFGQFERVHLARTGLRAVATSAFLLALYFLIPLDHRAHESVLLRISVATAFFVVVLASEIRLIGNHRQPMLRGAVAMATIIPLFLVLFSWIYLTLATSDPAAFGERLSRVSALYFTVTVFSTVGFGDITAKTDLARLVVIFQMLADLAVLAVVVRLILDAATRGSEGDTDR